MRTPAANLGRIAVGLVVVCLGLAACSKPARTVDADGRAPTASARQASAGHASAVRTVATAIGRSVAVHHGPDGPILMRLANPNEDGAPLVFLVEEQRPGWLRVLLPVRPNGANGWIGTDAVTLSSTGYRIDVYLAAHRIVVSDGARAVDDEPIGVGRANTPTPGGEYYITELLQQPTPDGPYGPYAYGLSGYSNVLHAFNGGTGIVGIHGTNDPAGLGHDVSHGCIRMSNAGISKLAHLLPLGTPVDIHP
jgi:lipoprotein-anchoring transpeptidase ErfK/SrfK